MKRNDDETEFITIDEGLEFYDYPEQRWVCVCGSDNRIDWEPCFHLCDEDGEEVESEEWTSNKCACDDCGRIIDMRTLEVIGRRKQD